MKKLSNWRQEALWEHNAGSAKNCKKGEYFCKTDHKCKPIPKGYHVMPNGDLMKDSAHKKDVKEEAPPTAKHERMVKHIKKSYKKDGKLSKDEKSIAYATAWKNYNKEEIGDEKKRKNALQIQKYVGEQHLDERLGGKGYKSYTDLRGKKVSGDWKDSDRGAGNKAKRRSGEKVEKKSPTYKAYINNKEEYVNEIAMKTDTKVPLGRSSNPFGKRAVAKMVATSIRDKVKQKAKAMTTYHKEDYIDELSKYTLASYIDKGSKDIAKRSSDASIKGMAGKRKEADKGYEKTAKRVRGVSKAGYKLALKELTSYRDFISSAQQARDRVKKKQTDKKTKDAQYSDMKKHGIKFYDKKGSGRLVGGKKKYD